MMIKPILTGLRQNARSAEVCTPYFDVYDGKEASDWLKIMHHDQDIQTRMWSPAILHSLTVPHWMLSSSKDIYEYPVLTAKRKTEGV